ncbi:MAG: hypothetical protein OEX00_06040, partial [Gammaproteobacteria bacterium]|nr:hypothetical protein [Gammaproteobacteria bacterium]
CVTLLAWISVQVFLIHVLGMSFSTNMFFMVFAVPAFIIAIAMLKFEGPAMTRLFCVLFMLPGPAILFITAMVIMSNGNVDVVAWAVAISFGESIAAILGAMIGILLMSVISPPSPPPKKTSVVIKQRTDI